MTVPSDAGKAESLTRPSSSVSVGSGGVSEMGIPDPGPQRSSRTSKGRRGKKKGKARKGRPISTTIEAGEYRTASGKVIRVDETTRVPMAESKKKQIRMATTIVFFSIIAVVVVAAVIAIVMITGGPGGGKAGGAQAYDPAANPYKLEFANVMGLPVTDRTVVVIEASEYSAEWSAVAGDMIAAGLSQRSSDGEIALIGAGGKPINFAGGPPRKTPIGAAETRGWFEKLPTGGEADIGAAITAALEWEPKTLIVINGYTEMTQIEAWDALIANEEELQLHVVHIGNSSPELEGWAGERGGNAVVLSIQDIETLKEIAAEEQED
ncbi:MAG: hypothetical protein AAGB26_05335 [Planctomycetota bacterium]